VTAARVRFGGPYEADTGERGVLVHAYGPPDALRVWLRLPDGTHLDRPVEAVWYVFQIPKPPGSR
jgi:hypothetical protein